MSIMNYDEYYFKLNIGEFQQMSKNEEKNT